jgi:hypothetical protein
MAAQARAHPLTGAKRHVRDLVGKPTARDRAQQRSA